MLVEPGTGTEVARITRGICDLIFETDGGLVLIDYKTDRITEEGEPAIRSHAQRYRSQIRSYVRALEVSTDQPVREAWLIFLNARGGIREIEVLDGLNWRTAAV